MEINILKYRNSYKEGEVIKINGTLVNYYFHCKKQCWLAGNRINLESNSEDVKIGKVLHETKNKGNNTELAIDNIKIDKLKGEYLIELKKSDSDIEAAKWQTLYYLKVLKTKGINKKGKIEVFEKKKNNNKAYFIELNDKVENDLDKILTEIKSLIKSDKPPIVSLSNKCKKCSYYEYCFI